MQPGLQLYTLRTLLERDFGATLDAVAAIGYREVQVSTRAGLSPAEIRRLLDDRGLVCPSIHLELGSPLEAEIEAALALGARHAVLSAPPELFELADGRIVGLRTLALDDWRAIAEGLDRTGERLRDAGLRFGYHNHHFELVPLDGVLPYELLLEQTDPGLVALEPDLGWFRFADVDPVPYLEAHPGRVPACHVKDVGADGTFVDPGEGVVDFAAVRAHAARAGIEHWFVEHDSPADPLETARAGYRLLEPLLAD